MIKSMTAYASSDSVSEYFRTVVEIRSLNSRYLDINIKLPDEYLLLENDIKKKIEKEISRGRIDVKIDIENKKDGDVFFEIDKKKALSYYNSLKALKEFLKIDDNISLNLFPIDEILQTVKVEDNIEDLKNIIEKSIDTALDSLDKMRIAEGAFLESEFHKRLDIIYQGIKKIEVESKRLPDIYHKKLIERIENLTENKIELDKMRIAQEAAFLADKSDITEEITRSFSHIEQFKKIMKEDEPSGKKLNFLLQEFNREFNTISSKANISEILYIIVELKAELEKMREQIQNIE